MQKFQCELFLEVEFSSPKWALAIMQLLDTSGFTDKKNRPRGEVTIHNQGGSPILSPLSSVVLSCGHACLQQNQIEINV